MKKIFLYIIIIASTQLSFSQNLRTSAEPSATINGESAFIDLSSFSSSPANESRGLLFPRTDLTSFQFVSDTNPFGFATGYDGMIVYNTVAGNTPATGSGVGSQNLSVGFYYFSNPTSGSVINTGEWLPLGGSKYTVGTTETETNAIIGTDAEYAIRVTGTADGTNTFLAISDSDWDLDTVKQLRKCHIYEGDTLIMTAMSTFEGGANNRIVTGNGMTNLLLRNTAADAYTAECYYTKN